MSKSGRLKYFAVHLPASAMPTLLATPWPSGPVVVSTPEVQRYSGWPGHLLSSCRAAVMSPPDAEAKVAKRPAGQWVVNQPGDSGNGKLDETRPGRTFPPPKCVLDSPQGAGQAGQRGVGDPPHAQRRARTSMS